MATLIVDEEIEITKTHFKTYNELKKFLSSNKLLSNNDIDDFNWDPLNDNFTTLNSDSLPWTKKDEEIWN